MVRMVIAHVHAAMTIAGGTCELFRKVLANGCVVHTATRHIIARVATCVEVDIATFAQVVLS